MVATDTFVFLCVTNVKGTIAMQCRRPAEMSHSTCPLADFDYVRPQGLSLCLGMLRKEQCSPFDSVEVTMFCCCCCVLDLLLCGFRPQDSLRCDENLIYRFTGR